MLSHQLLALAFAIAPSLVSAALFPSDSLVKMIDAKGFKKAMKVNETSMVAFVAPWCGHCQKMVPEYSKAALGLYPLVPTYAVDCDDEKNKRLCTEQGVQGFPTVKVYPRGKLLPSLTYESPERTASGLWYFAKRAIPMAYTKIHVDHDIQPWVDKHQNKHRAFLLNKDKKMPLLWQVLANKYQDQLEFASFRDRKGKGSLVLGIEAGEDKVSKVLLYPAGSNSFVLYEGIQKYDSLANFLDSVLDGTADLASIIEKAKNEEFVDEAELEIEQKQEAQRMALLHGGFTNFIDFEKALKSGGAGYHDGHGYGMGGMGGIPRKKPSAPSANTAATDSASSETTAAPVQKEDEAAEEPVAAPESVKAPEPVVEDKQKPVEGENISEQVVLDVPKDHDADASPAPSAERPKDEL